MLFHWVFWVCDHDLVFSLLTWASLIPHLALFGNMCSQEKWLHSTFLNCTLRTLNPQALTLSLRTMHYLVSMLNPRTWAQELCNYYLHLAFFAHCAVSSIKPQPWALELHNCIIIWPLSHHNSALGKFNLKASILRSWTPQLCNPLAYSPIWTMHWKISSLNLDHLSSSTT